jgi:hypothetical protein
MATRWPSARDIDVIYFSALFELFNLLRDTIIQIAHCRVRSTNLATAKQPQLSPRP